MWVYVGADTVSHNSYVVYTIYRVGGEICYVENDKLAFFVMTVPHYQTFVIWHCYNR